MNGTLCDASQLEPAPAPTLPSSPLPSRGPSTVPRRKGSDALRLGCRTGSGGWSIKSRSSRLRWNLRSRQHKRALRHPNCRSQTQRDVHFTPLLRNSILHKIIQVEQVSGGDLPVGGHVGVLLSPRDVRRLLTFDLKRTVTRNFESEDSAPRPLIDVPGTSLAPRICRGRARPSRVRQSRACSACAPAPRRSCHCGVAR